MERMGQPQPEAQPHRDGQQQSVDPHQQQATSPWRKANGLIDEMNGIGTRQLRVPVRATTTKGTTTFSSSHSAARLQQVQDHHITNSLGTEHHRSSDHSLLNQGIRASSKPAWAWMIPWRSNQGRRFGEPGACGPGWHQGESQRQQAQGVAHGFCEAVEPRADAQGREAAGAGYQRPDAQGRNPGCPGRSALRHYASST